MSTQTQVDVEATLSGGAAKLFLHLLRRGRVWGSMADMMAGAGISKPTYLAAKRELLDKELDLREFGFLTSPVKEVDHEVKYFDPAGQETLPQVKEVAPQGQGTFPAVWFPDTAATAKPPSFATDTASLIALAPILGVPVPEESRNFSEDFEKSPLALCAEADRMPAEGDRLRPTSEFQARRRAQVQAVCLTWSTLFPEQQALTTSRAKELLVAANDVAEDVYDALQSSAGKDYPFSYARKILTNTPKPATGAKSEDADHTGEKMDWTPEMEAKQRAGMEKLRKMPNLRRWVIGDEEP